MKDFRLEMKLRNNRILRRIEECGYPNVGSFRRAHPEVNLSLIYDLVNLKRSPFIARVLVNGVVREDQWLDGVLTIAKVLMCEPDDLFSDDILATRASNRAQMELDGADVVDLLAATRQLALPADAALDRAELKRVIEEQLETLTEKEAAVLRARFGLGPEGEELTLRETGKQLNGVTQERIRQIESKALRKLRHPTRAQHLRPWDGGRQRTALKEERIQAAREAQRRRFGPEEMEVEPIDPVPEGR